HPDQAPTCTPLCWTQPFRGLLEPLLELIRLPIEVDIQQLFICERTRRRTVAGDASALGVVMRWSGGPYLKSQKWFAGFDALLDDSQADGYRLGLAAAVPDRLLSLLKILYPNDLTRHEARDGVFMFVDSNQQYYFVAAGLKGDPICRRDEDFRSDRHWLSFELEPPRLAFGGEH
ncbi:hypothetical protein EB73_21180, partial [Mycobacterium sp. SWH-M3]